MRVKICGITNLEDALVAAQAGADALGFVFYEKSPRYIEPNRAKNIIKQLPPFIESVGLFVNESKEVIERVCKECGISLAQLHFEVDEGFIKALDMKALPVVRAKEAEDVLRFYGNYRLVDAYVEEYGGSGKRVALDWFEKADTQNIVLAGGLNPDNVKEIRKYGFYGVDVSSGVEAARGRKDAQKVRDFIKAAKFE